MNLWTKMRSKRTRVGAMLMGLVLCMSCVPVQPVRAANTKAALVIAAANTNEVIAYNAGETKKLELKVKNIGSETLTDVKIVPEVSVDISEWPFEVENKDYTITVDSLAPGAEADISYELTARDTVNSQYYKLPMSFTAVGEASGAIDGEYAVYVKTVKKAETNPGQGDTPQKSEDPAPEVVDTPDGGGISNGGAFSAGGGSENSSIPRVIVTGFTTNPSEVKAGSDFKLTIHLKNTSKNTTVTNMLFDLSAPTEGDAATASPAFLPTSGSSSIYLDKIAANGTQDITISLNAKADLLQKPYSVDLSMKYQDKDGGSYESTSSVSIPIKQDARYEFSEFEINPTSITVGDEANVMCQIYNLGRVKLYNVKATFTGEGIEKEEVFVGNLESGNSASVDAMLTGAQPTYGPGTVTMTLSYEDESGKVSTSEKTLELEVLEEVFQEEDIMMEDPGEAKPRRPIIPIAIGALVLAGATTGVILWRKKRKARAEDIEEEF